MAEFKLREGQDRVVRNFKVQVRDDNGSVIYTRQLETAVIRNVAHYVKTVLDTLDSMVVVDKYRDIGFGDMDMCAEVNGHLLNIEFKGNMAKVLNAKGQLRQAINMAETSKVTTIFVEGTPDNPKRLFSVSHVMCFNDYGIKPVNGIDGLNVYIEQWEQYARKQKGVRGSTANDKYNELTQALQLQLGGF